MKDAAERLQQRVGEAYVIRRQLGQGGMAMVFLARDVKHDRDVAVKVLRAELSASVGRERFLREIRIAASLSHPRILPVHDSGGDDDLLYYVMPFVPGESLRDRLTREGPLPIHDALAIAQQVAAALAYAHGRGVVHRDIKPENILLHEGEAVVTDFGIARAIAAAGSTKLTETGIVVGTPAYMPPEQAAGDKALDSRSDLYSLACVLYEMLAGHPPFLGGTAVEVMARHVADPVPSVSTARRTVPAHVERAIEKALAKVPADRFATATEFAERLESEADTEVRGRRRPTRWLAWAGLALALGGGAGVLARALTRGRRSASGPAANTVAVLYFDNESPDSADGYLADGVSEEIMQRLGEVPRLAVKSRYAVRGYRGFQTTPARLGQELGVANLVSGSLQHVGNRVRVRAELVRAATGLRVWANEYDRTDTAVLDVESEVAGAIAAAIAGRLDPAERTRLSTRPTASPAAYDHFLRGDYFLAQRTPAATSLAIEQYRGALGIDSTFTRAWARDAVGYALFLAYGWPHELPTDTLLARGLRAAHAALALDSTSSDAWMAFGMFQWLLHPDTWAGAAEAHLRAVSLDSANAEAQNMLGVTLFYLGRDSAAELAFHRALAVDPLRPITLTRLSQLAWFRGHDDQAMRYCDSALAISPAFVPAYIDRAEVRLRQHDLAGAEVDLQTAEHIASDQPTRPRWLALLAAIRAQEGDTIGARAAVRRIEASRIPDRDISFHKAPALASAYLYVGERDRAMSVLESAPRGRVLSWSLRWPQFDPLRSDPRFQRLVAGMSPATTGR